ncbi:MAG: RidA family protein [Deltaproteobacteria bacterium]|nr:RidA family protein [Deltaproteobacteria bacterium]
MQKESIPFGRTMGMKVAFCNAIALDLKNIKRLIWVSGQIAYNEKEEFIGKGDIRTQTEQVLKNIQAHLQKLGGTMGDVVQVVVFVKDMTGLKEIHDARLQYFKEPYPTSTLVAVSGFVNPDALIEINALAAVGRN